MFLDWIIIGCFVTLVYYFCKLDLFVARTTILRIERMEREYSDYINSDTREKLSKIKNNCLNYKPRFTLVSIFFDIIIFPFCITSVLFSAVTYFNLKNKK